jgi:hypothetical protein
MIPASSNPSRRRSALAGGGKMLGNLRGYKLFAIGRRPV